MSCPTCDHTMAQVGITGNGGRVFHCERCGTLTQRFGDGGEHYPTVPKLVPRCREFWNTVDHRCAKHMYEWKQLGIAEAINVPDDRPK